MLSKHYLRLANLFAPNRIFKVFLAQGGWDEGMSTNSFPLYSSLREDSFPSTSIPGIGDALERGQPQCK